MSDALDVVKFAKYFLVLLLLAAFARGEVEPEIGPKNITELFQTPENLEVVRAPEWVEICILSPKKPWFSRKRPTKYGEGKYQKLLSEEAALLSAKLSDETTYQWNLRKYCIPTYNARARFHRGDQVIAADFCFGCDIVIFQKEGAFLNGEDFDGASEEIFEVVRAHFPKEKIVAELMSIRELAKRERANAKQGTER